MAPQRRPPRAAGERQVALHDGGVLLPAAAAAAATAAGRVAAARGEQHAGRQLWLLLGLLVVGRLLMVGLVCFGDAVALGF